MDSIHVLRKLTGKCVAKSKKLRSVFVDLREAYISVPRLHLREAVRK
jgi:hypothetical protein